MTILNHFAVSDSISTSGQPTADQFESIAAEGFEVVINLALPDHKKSIANEGALVTGLGMTYIHIPVPFDAPDESHYERFAGYMDALSDAKVWVHCIVNARVSAFMFRYLQANRGYSPEQAQTPLLKAWRADMDEVWSAFVARAPGQVAP